jgi:hypothetical protein
MKPVTGGALAVRNGESVATIVREMLSLRGYRKNPEKTLKLFDESHNELFPGEGQYAEKIQVPLIAHYHRGAKRFAEADFFVYTLTGFSVLISVKSQHSDGTAEEKLEYEYQQLLATEIPVAMFVFGPIRGVDAKHGWNSEVLCQVWERARHFGGSGIYLFRKPEKLAAWIDDGFPLPRGRETYSSIFARLVFYSHGLKSHVVYAKTPCFFAFFFPPPQNVVPRLCRFMPVFVLI